eukprot:TRINITY_DN18977_c0_g1_i1.p1 TRINITY_DN18977_c0_g1~~TRINITY_DN18977_c0_g1_i1.p1  ORF type:complete len:235 (+),score=37.13 TRINITY_DN18977_c0_g1_i1:346-1050(+)
MAVSLSLLIQTWLWRLAHATALFAAWEAEDGCDRTFTYGRVVNTANFDDPSSEPFKLTDLSAAFFATGNVAVSRRRLEEAAELLGSPGGGPFDAQFSEYGWEDLELGERLRQRGARIAQCPAAVGFHWHPAFSCEQLPRLVEQERQRGRNGARFFQKHPTLNVRLMVQLTPFHRALWALLTVGGRVNEDSLRPLLSWLVAIGQWSTAAALLSPVLNWHTVEAVHAEARKLQLGK